MREIIKRREDFSANKFWITTSSTKMGDQWNNCLYLHFAKEDFPDIRYPELIPCDWPGMEQRFDYGDSDLASLNWHGGITFYEEIHFIESGKIFVKAGCDYAHYEDDLYLSLDCGERLLRTDGVQIAKEFKERFCK